VRSDDEKLLSTWRAKMHTLLFGAPFLMALHSAGIFYFDFSSESRRRDGISIMNGAQRKKVIDNSFLIAYALSILQKCLNESGA